MGLLEQIAEVENLREAFRRVKRNRGGPGVDGQSLAAFERDLERHLEELSQELREGRYVPPPVRRTWIPKREQGEYRPLGVPTVRDRVAQQAVLQVLVPLLDPLFCDCSYGYRPSRSPLQAIQRVEHHLRRGCEWVVEVDIEQFFDSVDHAIMMDVVTRYIPDRRVCRLIKRWLRAGVLEEGKYLRPQKGVPQGGVISPLLANLYLHRLDEVLSSRGYNVVRYADDLVLLSHRRWLAHEELRWVEKVMRKLHLRLHPEKTRVVHVWREGFDFLGYRFFGKWKTPTDQAMEEFKARVRQLTRRQQPLTLGAVIEQLNPYLRGWGQYFGWGDVKRRFTELDGWVRMRLRAFVLKRYPSALANQRLPNRIFQAAGLISLQDLRSALAPL